MDLVRQIRTAWARYGRPRLIPYAAAIAAVLLLYWVWPSLGSKDSVERLVATALAAPPLRWIGAYAVVLVAEWLPLFALVALLVVLNVLGRIIPGARPTAGSRFVVLALMALAYFGALELDVYPHLPEEVRQQYAISNAPDPVFIIGFMMIGLLAVFVIFQLARDLRKR